MSLRVAGKLGANARDWGVRVPTFEHYIRDASALPTGPLVTDRRFLVTNGWPMYGNDSVGDCTDAGMLHSVAAFTAYSGKVHGGALFTPDVPIKMYEATGGYVPGNPNTDNGATLQSVADYMVNTGVVDTNGDTHKLVAYAEIGDYTNLALLKKVLYAFGSVYCAVTIDQAAMDAFNHGQHWEAAPGSPQLGGHCIPLQLSADGDTAYPDDHVFVTWGAQQRASAAWVQANIQEAMVLISDDWIQTNGKSIDGLDLNTLIKDSQGL